MFLEKGQALQAVFDSISWNWEQFGGKSSLPYDTPYKLAFPEVSPGKQIDGQLFGKRLFGCWYLANKLWEEGNYFDIRPKLVLFMYIFSSSGNAYWCNFMVVTIEISVINYVV